MSVNELKRKKKREGEKGEGKGEKKEKRGEGKAAAGRPGRLAAASALRSRANVRNSWNSPRN